MFLYFMQGFSQSLVSSLPLLTPLDCNSLRSYCILNPFSIKRSITGSLLAANLAVKSSFFSLLKEIFPSRK